MAIYLIGIILIVILTVFIGVRCLFHNKNNYSNI